MPTPLCFYLRPRRVRLALYLHTHGPTPVAELALALGHTEAAITVLVGHPWFASGAAGWDVTDVGLADTAADCGPVDPGDTPLPGSVRPPADDFRGLA